MGRRNSRHARTEPPAHPPDPGVGQAGGPAAPDRPGDASGASRRWLRRLVWGALLVLAVALVLRIALALSLPWLLNKTVQPYGLRSSYERLTLSLLTMDMEARHLMLRAPAVPEPMADIEHFRGHVSIWSLAARRLLIYRAEIDGMEITALRDAQGTWRGLEGLLGLLDRRPQAAASARAQEEDARGRLRPLLTSLRPPVNLEGLSLHHLVVRFRDEMVTPPVEALLDLNLRLSDLGSSTRKTRFQLLVSCEPILNQLVVEGIGSAEDAALDATFTCYGRGLHLEPVRAYLAELGLEPAARTIDLGFRSDLHMAVVEPNAPAPDAPGSRSPEPKVLHCMADLADLRLTADGREDVGLGRCSVLARLGPGHSLQIQNLEVAEGQVSLRRVREQGIEVAGLSVITGRPPASSRRPDPVPMTRDPAPQARPALWAWTLEGVHLEDLALTWQDRVAVPETEAAIRLEDAQIGPLRGGAGSAPVDAAILARFSGPGLFESCEVAGRADLLSAVKTCDLDLRVQGVSFKALLPYLDQLGLESEYEAGRFACHVTASVGPRPPDGLLGGDLAVRDLRLEDRAELFGLEGLALSGALWDPGRSTLRLNTVEVTGQRLALGRDPQGRFRVLGLRVKGPGQTPGSGASSEGRPTRPQSTSVPSAQGPARRTGRVEIGRFVWRDNEIVLEDQALSERPKVLRARFGVELNDLILDLADPNAAPGPARFQAFLQIPPLAGDIRVNGALAGQAPAGWGVDLSVVGQDLDTREVAEYLRPLGLEPRISQGDLKAEVHVDLTLRPDGLGVSAAVQDLQIRDAGQTIAGLDRLQVRDLVLGPVLDVNEVRIHGPQVLLGRDPNGALLVCGMRVAPVSGARTRKPAAQSGSTVHLNRVAVQAGKVRWIDQALAVPLDVAATVDVTVDDLTLGAGGRPARVKAQVRANPIAEQVEVSGQLFTDPQRLGADVSVDAAGLCATALGGYLPPGVAPGLDRGSLHLEVLGLMEPGPQGRRTTLQVQHLDLRETDSPDPILHVDLLRTLVARPDPNAIVVEECSVQGVEATVQRTDANEVALAGLRLGPREAHAPSSSPPVNLEPARAALQAEDTASAQRSGPATFPDVTVQSLDLQVRRVSWIDRCLAGAAPVHIEDLRVRNGSPWHLQGKSPPDSPPMDLEVAGRVAPLVDAFTVHAQATPFAEEPNLMVDLAVEGIHGSGLTLVRPDLAGRVDGSSLQAGRVGARVHAILDMPRRNPLQYDLRRPFGLHLQLSGLQVTEANDPAPLAGLSQVDLEIERADIPNRKVQVKRVEVVRPQCRLVREPGGVRLLDVLMRPAPGPAETEPHREDPAQGGSDGREPFEVTVEQLVVSGLDVACADTTVDPPVEIPLTGLDLEVQGLSTRALSEPVPIRFSAALTSGRVDLGPGRGSADAPGQDPNTQAGQTGPLFQEVTAVGRLTCGPVPTGWIKGSLGGLELRALRGLAKAHGVVLRDGVLDVGLDVRLASGQAKTRANVVLTDLSLTEPNEGPLLKLLSLPVSLDTALFLLQGPDGSIRLPLQFTITGQGVSPKEITGAAVGAAASVVAEAVAGAALRPALAVFQALGGDTQEDKRQETLELTFPAGVLEVTAQQRADLEAVADRVRRDRRMSLTVRHELGAEDMAAAEALANPPAPDRVALLGRLRSQRQAALALRNRLVEQAYVARVGGEFPDIRKATDDLAAATRQAALFDRSIDALLETLRPGTGHAAARRTREAVLLMAQTRLDIVAEILGHADRPDQTPQIQIPAPSLAVAEGLAQTRIMITMTRSRTR